MKAVRTEGMKGTMKARLEKYYILNRELPLIADAIWREQNETRFGDFYPTHNGIQHTQRRFHSPRAGNPKTLAFLQEREQTIQKEIDFLTSYVYSVPDSELRQIMIVAYLEGGREKRWDRVADHFGGEISGDAYRKRMDRYFEKLAATSRLSVLSQFQA